MMFIGGCDVYCIGGNDNKRELGCEYCLWMRMVRGGGNVVAVVVTWLRWW
jgi:hypothetical protein